MNFSSLRFKIYFGFAFISLQLIFVALFAFLGLSSLNQGLDELQQTGDLNYCAQATDLNIKEMRIRVNQFVHTGQASLVEEIHDIGAEAKKNIDAAKLIASDDAEVNGNLEVMQSRLTAYLSQFNAVVTERQLRQELANDRLPKLVTEAEDAIADLSAKIIDDDSKTQNQLHVARCITGLSQAEKSFLRYFKNPNTTEVNKAIEHINLAIASATQVSGFGAESKKAVQSLEEVTNAGLQAVQSTRSYLFLLNVVMAGDQSEVTYYANKIRGLASQRKTAIAAHAQQTASRATWLTIGLSSILILLSLITAAHLAYLILPPLSMLKDTFGRLSAGETLADIPGSNRKDEIGELSHAASVFSDQNRKTRELLQQSTRLTKELEKQANELSSSNEELDRFAYIASHDLKSPLRGIRQLASWIEEDAGQFLPEESLMHVQKVQSRVTKMEGLLEDLLNYSRVGSSVPSTELVDTGEMLANVIEILDNHKGVQINVGEGLPEFQTLKAPFKQVWMNLIGNAIAHHDKAQDGWIELALAKDRGDFYEFIVRDNGPGIDQINHERVFEMFQRVGTNRVDGTGMGLAIVKKQVEHMGGTISLESQLGNGSTFIFTWPKQVHETQ